MPANNFLWCDKCTAADEENFFCIDLDIFLVRMFAPSLRRNVTATAFQNLEKRLLDAFSGDISSDADIIRLSPDFVDLVDVHDTNLGTFYVIIGILQQSQNDVFDILTDVSSFSQSCRIGDAKRHIENPREGASQKSLS